MKPKYTTNLPDFEIITESYESGWSMQYTHFHPQYELYILKSGQRTVFVDDEKYITRPFSVTLFNKNSKHRSEGDTPFSGICIHFKSEYLDRYFKGIGKDIILSLFKYRLFSITTEELSRIDEISKSFNQNDRNNFLKLSEIINILLSATYRLKTNIPPIIDNSHAKNKQILAYVNENYTFISSINEIAEAFGVSEGYIFKIFKNQYNTTPKLYINNLRMLNVRHQLEVTSTPIKEIALNSGFNSYEYFMRLFKKELGITPTEYRNKHKNFSGGI